MAVKISRNGTFVKGVILKLAITEKTFPGISHFCTINIAVRRRYIFQPVPYLVRMLSDVHIRDMKESSCVR